jgi:hypothetical protein
MENQFKIRYAWLKGMYIYTILASGISGLAIILMPETYTSMLGLPMQEPINYGILGSVYLAFGLISILGLRSPLKFAPILLVEMTYKIIWFIGIVLPLIFTGQFPEYALINTIIFATFIIGNAIAIPFKYLFKKQLT